MRETIRDCIEELNPPEKDEPEEDVMELLAAEQEVGGVVQAIPDEDEDEPATEADGETADAGADAKPGEEG